MPNERMVIDLEHLVEVKALDFHSWEHLKSNIKEITGHEEAEIKKLISIERTFSKQLNESLRFISLKGTRIQLKIILGDGVFYYHPHPLLDDQMEYWRNNKKLTSSYDLLCFIGFQLLEIIQNQTHSLESYMDKFEAEILENPKKSHRRQIIELHGNAMKMKKLLDGYHKLFVRHKQDSPLWDELLIQLQTGLDDSRVLLDLIENIREAHQASMDNQFNAEMKFLTVLATIMLPLNLLTGFFGMNFEVMPFTQHPYGIAVFLAISLGIVGVVFFCFKRKKWI